MTSLDEENISEEIKPKKKRRIIRKILLGFFILFVLAEAFLWFAATPLLRSKMQKFVAEESRGIYSIDFDRIHFDLTTGSFKLINFRLKADTTVYKILKKQKKVKAALYEVSIDNLVLRNMSYFNLIFNDKLKLSKIEVDNPSVNILDFPIKTKTDTVNYDAIHKDLYSAISPYFEELRINKILIHDGYFNLKAKNTFKKEQSVAEKIDIKLFNFKLDSTTYRAQNKLFYSDSLILFVNDYHLKLNDNIHNVSAKKTKISLSDSIIIIRNAKVYPDSSAYSQHKNKIFYEIDAKEIKLTGTKIYKAWFKKEIDLRKIHLNSAVIKIHTPDIEKASNKEEREKTDYKNIYPLIEKRLKSISVDEFVFSDVHFLLYKGKYERSPSFEIKNLSLKLEHFDLDSSSYSNNDKIFYSNDFVMSVEGYKMKLARNSHILSAEKFVLSTKSRDIKAENIHIRPLGDSVYYSSDINATIPYLVFQNIDIKKGYNTGEFYIELLKSSNPNIIIKRKKKTKHNKYKKADEIYDIVSDYLSKVIIDKILLDNGKFEYTYYYDKQKNAFYKGNISLKLSDFILDENTTKRTDRLFYAGGFDVNLKNYSMKSAEDLHLLRAGKLSLSTSRSQLSIEDLQYVPIDNELALMDLKRYNKKNIIRFYLGKLSFNDINIKKALFEKELIIKDIKISKPMLFVQRYKDIKTRSDEDTLKFEEYFLITNSPKSKRDTINVQKEEIENAFKRTVAKGLSKSLNKIEVNRMSVDSGYLYVSIYDTLDNRLFAFDSYASVKYDDFAYYKDSVSNLKPLFYGSSVVEINDYNTYLSDNKHKIKIQKVLYFSKDSSLLARNIEISPVHPEPEEGKVKMYLKSKLANIKGIDIGSLISEKTLNAEMIYFPESELDIYKFAGKSQKKKRNIKINMSGIKNLMVNKIIAHNGKMRYYSVDDDLITLRMTADYELNGKELYTDTGKTSNFPFFVNKLGFEMRNMKYNLPDNMYFVTADTIRYGIASKKIEIFNLEYYPDTSKNVNAYLNEKDKSSLNKFTSERIVIQNPNLEQYVVYSKFIADKTEVFSPKIYINKLRKPTENHPLIESNEKKIKEILLKTFTEIKLNKVDLINASVVYKNKLDYRKNLKINNIYARIDNFIIDSSETNYNKIFFSDDILLTIKDFTFEDTVMNNTIKISNINYSTSEKNLKVSGFNYIPKAGIYKFSLKRKNKSPFIRINGKEILIKNFDIQEFSDDNRIYAKDIIINGADVYIFQDIHDSKTDSSKIRTNPLFLLLDSKQYINIEKISADKLNLTFEQNSKKSPRIGKLTYNDISLNAINFTNDTSLFKEKKLRIKIKGKLQNQAKTDINLSFNLENYNKQKKCNKILNNKHMSPLKELLDKFKMEGYTYNFNGHIDTCDLTILNPFLENVAFVKINSGTTKKVDFTINNNEQFAEGTMFFFYRDLNIEVLDTNKTTKKAITAATNAYLRNNNPKRRLAKLKQGKVYYEKNPYKSEFNLWAQALLSGVYSSLGKHSKEQKRRIKYLERLKKAEFLRINKKKKNEKKELH